jgi:REP element-mobilizing transposase RayT
MGHTYISILVHVVFSTRNRLPQIDPVLAERLHPYLCGIARENGFKILGVGGVPDHLHALLSLSGSLPPSKAVQLLKGGSSKWVHETFPDQRSFAWQEGYGAFSVGISQIDDTLRYIANQVEHHRQTTFQDEYRAFLARHGIAIDEHHVWG